MTDKPHQQGHVDAVPVEGNVVANAGSPNWTSGLFDCFSSFGICFQTVVCGICTLTNVATKLHTNSPVCDCGTCCGICCCGTGSVIPCAPKEWSTGLCACTGKECVEGCFCPCFVAGHMAAAFDDALTGTRDPSNPRCDAVTGVFAACSFTLHYMLRREAIARYRIWGESHCNTLCMLYWCFPCAIMQARREMGMHREWPGGCCVKEAPASVTDNLSRANEPSRS